MISKSVFVVSALLVAGAAHGAVLYSIPYDTANPAGGGSVITVSPPIAYLKGYEAFSLSSRASVSSVDFVGLFDPSSSDIGAFTITIYSDSAGLPGAAVSTRSFAGDGGPVNLGVPPDSGLDTYAYSLRTGPTPLAAGNYWLSIVASTDQAWYWGESLTGPFTGQVSNDGVNFRPTNVDFAFTLNGFSAVPEPSSWAIMTIGLGAAGMALRRRRRPLAT